MSKKVVLAGACRTAIGKMGGGYGNLRHRVPGQPGGRCGDDRRRMVDLSALPGRGCLPPDTLRRLFHGGRRTGDSQAPFQYRKASQRNGALLLFQKVQVR